MHLDDWTGKEVDRVPDRIAVVRPRARVDDERVDVVHGLVTPVDVFALAVGLAAAHTEAELARPRVDARLELLDRLAAVELRIAAADDVQVHAVEDVHTHAATLVLYTETSDSSARRTSSAGRSTPATGRPGASSSTSLGRPSTAFLSRAMAAHARSSSTRAGFGSSSLCTVCASSSRPESRSAAISPSATARPC